MEVFMPIGEREILYRLNGIKRRTVDIKSRAAVKKPGTDRGHY
jgi:hypothetical protein